MDQHRSSAGLTNTESIDHVVDWANLVPAAAMSAIWLIPMVLFWGMAFGPLRPSHAPRLDNSPYLPVFLVCCGLCLLPCALPGTYYVSKEAARARRLYERLGVRSFKRLVANGDLVKRWTRLIDPSYRAIAGRADLEGFLERTRAVERSHLVLLVFTGFTAIHATRIGWFRWAIFLTAANIVCNLYPVLLQRYNRARVRVFARQPK